MVLPKVELTISMRPEILARVEAAVDEGRSTSQSAYIEDAVVGQLAAEEDFNSFITEMLGTSA